MHEDEGSWEQGALGREGEPAPQQWPEAWRIDINDDGTVHLWNELAGWTGKGRWTYTDKHLRLQFHGYARDSVMIVEWVWADAISAESERYGSFGAWLRRPPGELPPGSARSSGCPPWAARSEH